MEENKLICSHCEAIIDADDYEDVDGQIVCAESLRIKIYEKYCPCREQKHPRPDPDALLPMRAVFLF